jgi:hypothetical protein
MSASEGITDIARIAWNRSKVTLSDMGFFGFLDCKLNR